MAGLHCSDCIFSTIEYNQEVGAYQGSCSRGYTLADPKVKEAPKKYFVEDPQQLVPTITPFGDEYLRTSNVCTEFRLPHKKG